MGLVDGRFENGMKLPKNLDAVGAMSRYFYFPTNLEPSNCRGFFETLSWRRIPDLFAFRTTAADLEVGPVDLDKLLRSRRAV